MDTFEQLGMPKPQSYKISIINLNMILQALLTAFVL